MDTQTVRRTDDTQRHDMTFRSDDEKRANERPVPALEWPQDLFADEAPSH